MCSFVLPPCSGNPSRSFEINIHLFHLPIKLTESLDYSLSFRDRGGFGIIWFLFGRRGGGKRKERLMNEIFFFLLFPWHFRGLSVTRFRFFFFPSWFVFRLLFPLSFFTLQQRPCFRFPSLSFPRPPLLYIYIYIFFFKSPISHSLSLKMPAFRFQRFTPYLNFMLFRLIF